jgi:hypothetical protein
MSEHYEMSDTAPGEGHSTEIEALADLIHSDGWTLFLAHIDAEWGPVAYARQIDKAIADGKQARFSQEEIAESVSEIALAARKVQAMSQWPSRRLSELKAKAREKPGMFAQFKRA